MESDYLKLLWNSRKTILRLLEIQKYAVSSYHLSFEDFLEWAEGDSIRTNKEAMTLVLSKERPKPEKVVIMWLADGKLGENIQNVLFRMNKEESNRAIVIVDDGVTPSANALIKNLARKKIRIETSLLRELQFVITDHEYVPEHKLCGPKIKNEILKAYGIKINEMPAIKINDPAIKHLGAYKGQLVQIIRESDTQPGNKIITYRAVV